MKKLNGCPYKASNNNQCTHKGSKLINKVKRYCGFELPLNCPLYKEWLALYKKSQKTTLKSKPQASQD